MSYYIKRACGVISAVIIPLLLLSACHSMYSLAKHEREQDRSICLQKGEEGSSVYKQCMEALDQLRADKEFKGVQQDLDEYDRLKQDRLNQHLQQPNFR